MKTTGYALMVFCMESLLIWAIKRQRNGLLGYYGPVAIKHCFAKLRFPISQYEAFKVADDTSRLLAEGCL